MKGTGLFLGKFFPPHLGHVHAAEMGVALSDELWVAVCSLPGDAIPGTLRHAWMRELVPAAKVVHLGEVLPQTPAEHPRFYEVWAEALSRVAPRPDVVFASEDYGPAFAASLGARFVPVDPGRLGHRVSGTAARQDPFAVWDELPRPVRAHFALRVSIFGPESTGKTTLAEDLARRLGTVWVPEWARTYLEALPDRRAPVLSDLSDIVRGQIAAEDSLAKDARHVLVCDTDPLATVVWSETLFGAVDPEVRARASGRRYDLTLLCAPDVPWVKDDVRYLPEGGRAFFAQCEEELRRAGRPYVVVSGDFAARLETAERAVRELIRSRRSGATAAGP